MAALGGGVRGSLLNRVFYALFYLCKIMFQLNETRTVIARNYIRNDGHFVLLPPPAALLAKGLVAHSCDAL